MLLNIKRIKKDSQSQNGITAKDILLNTGGKTSFLLQHSKNHYSIASILKIKSEITKLSNLNLGFIYICFLQHIESLIRRYSSSDNTVECISNSEILISYEIINPKKKVEDIIIDIQDSTFTEFAAYEKKFREKYNLDVLKYKEC